MSGWPAAARFVIKWTVVGLAAAFVAVLIHPEWLQPPAPPQTAALAPASFADAVSRAAPAVVNIFAARLVRENTGGQASSAGSGATPNRSVETGLGSGVIVDNTGHVITNHHVVACAQQIYVQLADGRIDRAAVVGVDPATDLAVLKIQLQPLPAAPLGQSGSLRTGDIVLAIGTPYGLSQTVTQGIVSALGRGQLNVAAIEGFIQTDAAINEGNSGGALINTNGELIGINTAALPQQLGVTGISFAIPVNLVRGVMTAILAEGRVKRGWFGVETTGLSSEQAAALGMPVNAGLLIKKVYTDSPAQQAGLQPGDIILRIDGAQRSMSEALTLVASKQPGDTIALSILRQNTRYDFRVTLEERQAQADERIRCEPETGR